MTNQRGGLRGQGSQWSDRGRDGQSQQQKHPAQKDPRSRYGARWGSCWCAIAPGDALVEEVACRIAASTPGGTSPRESGCPLWRSSLSGQRSTARRAMLVKRMHLRQVVTMFVQEDFTMSLPQMEKLKVKVQCLLDSCSHALPGGRRPSCRGACFCRLAVQYEQGHRQGFSAHRSVKASLVARLTWLRSNPAQEDARAETLPPCFYRRPCDQEACKPGQGGNPASPVALQWCLTFASQAQIFTTDIALAVLMSAPRSVISWDMVVQRAGAAVALRSSIFLDIREGSSVYDTTVNETAQVWRSWGREKFSQWLQDAPDDDLKDQNMNSMTALVNLQTN
eukprot:766595-Hanusia_phi.AAC.5